MQPGGRLAAAIEILESLERSSLPLDRFLAQWARQHRYAGSKDRAAITALVYDVMRHRGDLAWHMSGTEPRALALGAACLGGAAPAEIRTWCDGVRHNPPPLSSTEWDSLTRLHTAWARSDARSFGDSVRNLPDWLRPRLAVPAESDLEREIAANNARAPTDLRANALRTDRSALADMLRRAGLNVDATPFSRLGLRIHPQSHGQAAKSLTKLEAYRNGQFEVQDEGMQVAALLVDAGPCQQVLDLCAGAGGKSLVMAAAMRNTGQVFACDVSAGRLRRLRPRLERAGFRNVQIKTISSWRSDVRPGRDPDFSDHAAEFDRVLVDAPCSGSGVWRRNPDAKWRLTPQDLEAAVAQQRALLDRAAALVKPGGRLVYVTCSMIEDENGAQIARFLRDHTDFSPRPWRDVACAVADIDATALEERVASNEPFLYLTPSMGTDGAYVAILDRST